MSRFIFLLSACCFPGILFCQTGYPFPTDSAEWHVTKVTPILGPDDAFDRWEYRVSGDTFVTDSTVYVAVAARGTCHSDPSTSYQYKPYQPAQYAIIGGLRQEGDSIFFRRIAFPNFTGAPTTVYSYPLDQEVLLYDFSLEKGDTIEYVTPDRKFVVENVTINAQGRKEIQLSSYGCGYPINITWREGQGCTNGLLETICFYFYAGSCFYSETTGEQPCMLPCTPDDPVLVSTDNPVAFPTVVLSPNPSSGWVTLHVEEEEWPLQVVVHDLLGRVIHRQLMDQPTVVLNLNHIESGAVLVTVLSQGGKRQSNLLTLSQ